VRLFVGIPLDLAVAGQIQKASAFLRSAAGRLRWTEPGSWHITLQFLGNMGLSQLPQLVARLREIESPAFPIRHGRIQLLPRAGVLVVGVDVSPLLAALQQKVSHATAALGIEPDRRPYQPHLTLARIKDQAAVKDIRRLIAAHSNPEAFSPFESTNFLLYEGFLSREGSRYEVRAQFPLASPTRISTAF
jgi:RNA 2',3'-cyclic 3'-phosphodiesterase